MSETSHELSAEERHDAARHLQVVRLAGESMMDVIASAEALLAWPVGAVDGTNIGRARAVFETGMVVTYARPFIQSKLRMLGPTRGLPSRLRELHDDLLDRRHKADAHTDETPWREVLDGPSPDEFLMSTYYATGATLDDVISLAQANLTRFLADHEELETRYGARLRLTRR